jgi:hypothetical protein
MLLGSGNNGQRGAAAVTTTGGCGAELVMLPWN